MERRYKRFLDLEEQSAASLLLFQIKLKRCLLVSSKGHELGRQTLLSKLENKGTSEKIMTMATGLRTP